MDDPQGTTPHLLIAYVQCSNGHPLPGIFILLRPKTNEPTVLGELFGPPDAPFSLAMTDHESYLQLLPETSDPWPAFYSADNPHALKILSDHPYECYFIRHPDPAYAQDAAEELNGGKPRILTEYWKPATKTFTIGTKQLPDGGSSQELVLTLDEQPDSYYPRGSSRYGKWVLYRDMPHAGCGPVKQAVGKLQTDLGALRYVIGADPPYLPEDEKKDKKQRVLNPETANKGIFDSRTLNAVYMFQSDALGGKATRVDNRAGTIGKAGEGETSESSIAYLKAAPARPAAPKGMTADGVVDAVTGDAIGYWHEQGLCNPQSILVCLPAREGNTNWYVWARKELAESLYAWRELTKALGFAKGIAANHTYRSVLVDVGHAAYGRSAVSIHKTGLAVDVGVANGFTKPVPDWPIVFVRDAIREKKNAKGEVEGHRIYWRLFGVSNFPKDRHHGIEQCRTNLQAAKEDKHILAVRLRRAASDLVDEIDNGTFLENYFRKTLEPWDYDPYHPDGGTVAAPVTASEKRAEQRKKAEEELAALIEEKNGLNLRITEIEQIPKNQRDRQMNAEHANKMKQVGRLSRQITSKENEIAGLSEDAVYYVDLTALANKVGLERIGSFVNKLKPKGMDWGLAARAINTRNFKALAQALTGLIETHGNLAIELNNREVTISHIDTASMTQWAEMLSGLKLCRQADPQVSCLLSRHKESDQRVAQICSALDKFGTLTWIRTQTQEKKTGAAWSAEIKQKTEEIKTTAAPNRKDASKSSERKEKAKWTYTMLPTFGVSAGEPIVFLPGKVVYLPDAGAPIGMEWWHFQVQASIHGNWGGLLGELGWKEQTASDQRISSLYYREGAGYPLSELAKTAG